MRTSYELPFKLFGIPVKLNISFLIFFPLLAWLIGSQLDYYVGLLGMNIDTTALTTGPMPLLVGLIAAAGLFLGVTLHELGHSFVARSYGVQIKSITLHVLGGVAELEQIPPESGREAKMAISGPLVSFLLGAIAWAFFVLLSPTNPLPKFITGYMMYVNFAVGAFNLIPALPLDGGRVLRSLLASRQSRFRATQTATKISRGIAVFMGIIGILNLQIFLVLIAVYVYIGASSEIRNMMVHQALDGLKAKDLMTEDVITVAPDTTIQEMMEIMMERRHLGYPVLDNKEEVVGIVTLADLKESEDKRDLVRDVMTSQVVTIKEYDGAEEAFTRITQNNLGRLIVVDDTKSMVGIITRTDIMNALKIATSGPLEEQPKEFLEHSD